jgi:hypothetical protein
VIPAGSGVARISFGAAALAVEGTMKADFVDNGSVKPVKTTLNGITL